MKNNLKIKKNSLRVVISFTLSTLLLLILGFISLISVVSMILDNWNYLYILSTFLLISGLFFYFTQNKKLHKIRTIFFLIMVGAEVALFSFSIILINPNLLMIFFNMTSLIFLGTLTLEKKTKQLNPASKELEQKVKSLRQKSQLRIPPSNNVTKVKVSSL